MCEIKKRWVEFIATPDSLLTIKFMSQIESVLQPIDNEGVKWA